MPESADIAQEVLSLLVEDHYELAEIEIQVPVSRDLLRNAIEQLVQHGFAAWYQRVNDQAAAHPLTTPTEHPDLELDDVWKAKPLDSPRVLLGSTEAGETRHFGSRR